MQIIHVIDNLGIGGGQTMLFSLYQSIKKYYPEYKQCILTTERRNTDVKFVSSYKIPYFAIASNKLVSKVISQKEPSIVIFHKLMITDTTVYGEIIKNAKIPVIVLNHTYSSHPRYNKISFCDMIISVCNNMRKTLKKYIPNVRHVVIYNFLDYEDFKNIKSSRSPDKNTLFTGRINAFNRIKYSEDWLKWCSSVKLPLKMVHEYIGWGGYYRQAEQSAKRINKNRPKNIIKIIGKVENFEKKVSIIKSWDLFLYEINQNEGLSISILEAMANGVPVICSNHYGNREIIKNGINGYIFKNRSEAKSILKRLCKNRDELEELKKTTMQYFKENLDAKIRVKEYINLCEDVYDNFKFYRKKMNIKIEKTKEDKKKKKDKQKKKEKQKKKQKIEKNKETKKKKQVISPNNKFTILTSGYNNGKYIKDWAKSILAQKYRPLEVIYANDCSTDDTCDLLNDYSNVFKEVDIDFKIVNNKKRLYCGSSYNNAVQSATGDYVGILDSDDMLVEDVVEYIVKIYKEYTQIVWIYTQFQICDIKMNPKRKGFCSVPPKNNCLLDIGKKRIHGYGHWRTFSRKKIERPDKLFGKELKCGVDKYMGYRLEEFGPGMFVDKICYKYRQYPINYPHSVSSTKEAINVWYKIMKKAENRRKLYKYKPYPIKTYK